MATLEIRPQDSKHLVYSNSGGEYLLLEVCPTWQDAYKVLRLANSEEVPYWLDPPAKAEGGGWPTGSADSSLTNSRGQHNDH